MKEVNTPTLFVFDMGGVLIRENHMSERLLKSIGFDGNNLRQLGPKSAAAIEAHVRGLITETQFWDIVRKETGLHIERNLIGEFFESTVDEPTLRVIENLKKAGHRVVCGTNVIDAQWDIHSNLHQYDVFEKVYPSHRMHCAKPDREFYEMILKEENVSAENAFFTDDMQVNIDSALSVGMQAFRYENAELLEEQLKALKAL